MVIFHSYVSLPEGKNRGFNGTSGENPNKNAGFKLGQSLNQMGDSPASHVDYRRVSKKE